MIRQRLTSIIKGILILGFLAQWGWSQGTPESAQKFGFVDSLQVLYETQEGKREISKIQAFLEERQKDFDARRMELDRLRQQFESEVRTLDRQTGMERQRTIEDKGLQLKRFQEDTQGEITRRRDEALRAISEKVGEILVEYGEKQNFGVIFLRGETQVYVDPALDFTSQIIRIYDQKYGRPMASGPPPTTP
jgi:Skp family chaperone for outer membrane proteins